MKRSKKNILLPIGVCVALLPILLLRDFTPSNELRYLSVADEALRNHSFFAFSNHGEPYADKPPLYLWIVMLCRWLTGGHHMWLLSLFSLLPAWGIVRIMDRWTIQEMDYDGRMLAKLMLLTGGLFLGAAIALRMDMLMCFFIVLALYAFWQMQKGEDYPKHYRWQFPLFLFLALFTKGPMGLLIPLCATATYLIMCRRGKEFFRFWEIRTWGILLVCCCLWFGAVYAEGGADYLCNLLFKQTAGRAVHSFHHAAPFYYYLLSIWYCLAPWSLLIVGLVFAALRPKFIRSDLQCFFLAVGISSLVLLSCISSKLQIYMLPSFPFLVYVAVMFFPRYRENGWMRLALAVPAVAFSLALPVMLFLEQMELLPYLHVGTIYAAATILTLCGAHSLYLLYNKKQTTDIPEIIRSMGAAVLLAIFVGGWAMPKINAYTGYGKLCRKALKLSKEENIDAVMTWRLVRSSNIDVYLQRPVSAIADDKTPVETDSSYLLLTNRRFLTLFPGKETYTVGPYAVVVMKNGDK